MVSLIETRKLSSYSLLILTRLLNINIAEVELEAKILPCTALSCSKGLADEDQLHQKVRSVLTDSSKSSPHIG